MLASESYPLNFTGRDTLHLYYIRWSAIASIWFQFASTFFETSQSFRLLTSSFLIIQDFFLFVCLFYGGRMFHNHQAILQYWLVVQQFNEILYTIYPEISSDSTGWGLSPTRLPFTSDASNNLGLLPMLLTNWLCISEVLTTFSPGFIALWGSFCHIWAIYVGKRK